MIHALDSNVWLGMALELLALAVWMGSLSLYQRWQPLAPETSRKLFHIGGGLTTLTFPWVFASAWPVIALALITIPLLLALKYMRAFRGNLGTVLYRVERKSFGEIYFPLSVCLLFVFTHHTILLFLVPVLILTLADPMAAVIGCRYGRVRYPTAGGQKSIEGSLAFFLVAFLCALIPLLLLTPINLDAVLLIALLTGLLVMLTEAIAWEGLDNLFIPLCSWFLLTALLQTTIQLLCLELALTLCLLPLLFWLARHRTLREVEPC